MHRMCSTGGAARAGAVPALLCAIALTGCSSASVPSSPPGGPSASSPAARGTAPAAAVATAGAAATSAPGAAPTASGTAPAPLAGGTPIGSQAPVRYARDADGSTPRNDVGNPLLLDAAGSRTCSFAEFAFRAPETGDDPAADLASMRETVRSSKNSPLVSAVAALPPRPAPSSVESVLEVCVTLGYQL